MATLRDPKAKKRAEEKVSKEGFSVADAVTPLGMVGGLPSGLNPEAIRMLLKQVGIDVGENTAGKVLSAADNVVKPIVERRKAPGGLPPMGVSERRYEELMKRFGGFLGGQ